MSQDLPSEVQQQILEEFKKSREVGAGMPAGEADKNPAAQGPDGSCTDGSTDAAAKAFEKLYEFYYEMILKYLLKMTMSSEVAYDLTADTFIKAFEGLHKFKWTGVSIKVWLYRIAINALKNYRRHPETAVLTEAIEGQESLVADVKEELKELDKALFGDEKMPKLSDAMATLKPEHQNVVSLYYFSGMSQKEIAETTNTSESAVKATMHRAMTNLRELLSPNPA